MHVNSAVALTRQFLVLGVHLLALALGLKRNPGRIKKKKKKKKKKKERKEIERGASSCWANKEIQGFKKFHLELISITKLSHTTHYCVTVIEQKIFSLLKKKKKKKSRN